MADLGGVAPPKKAEASGGKPAVNGTLIGTSPGSAPWTPAQSTGIGGRDDNAGDNFHGQIDEVRYSTTARSSDWIGAEYRNQSSPSTFYSVGAPQPIQGGTPPIGTPGGASVTYVQGNSATPQLSQTAVSVMFTTPQLAGDLNVVVVGWNDSTATVSAVTDKAGNLYHSPWGRPSRPESQRSPSTTRRISPLPEGMSSP